MTCTIYILAPIGKFHLKDRLCESLNIIEVDVKGDSTTDFLRFHNQKTTKMNNNEMILKLPDEKSTVFVDNEILCITGSVFATIGARI